MPRAAVHSLRRLPPNPPGADRDWSHTPPVSSSVNPVADSDTTSATGHFLGHTPERTRSRTRRTSTLPYQNSVARDLRGRGYSRSPRNLVVVIPPPDLPLDQGHLGSVLSMGPRGRLSHGILMPLFPSMFGQLNAIAREYNFPSTIGLCLYLHINENGTTMTPRISDDSWQHLFGHLFDDRPPSGGQQLPIGGSIEFDIDLNKARWFDAWISGTLRDPDPVFPQVVTSRASLEAHWRAESQTINVDEQLVEDRWDTSGSHTVVTNSRPETLRHLPKKLSLVDRLELHGVHVAPKTQNHPVHRDSTPTDETHASSPILSSAIPQAGTSDLEHRVRSWRATAELYPVSMTETYQPAPDAGVSAGVTTIDEYVLERNFRQAVCIDEFHWSVPSVGPRSTATELPTASSSGHLDRHANETVPITPATVTSWGPTDDEWHPIASSVTRSPSSDMGERIVEDVMAPRPRAVWGNSFGWRSAITWKDVYPYSVIQSEPTIRLQDSNGLMPQYPNLVIYPTMGSRPDTRSPHIIQRLKSSPQSVGPIQLRGAGGLEPNYPNLCIYPAIYPYFEIYPACIIKEDVSQPVSERLIESKNFFPCYPSLVIYPSVYPHLDIYPPVVEGIKMKGSSQVDTNIYSLSGVSTLYPNLVIYPAVYPHFDLCPPRAAIAELEESQATKENQSTVYLILHYPNLIIYPVVYPHFDLYPAFARAFVVVERGNNYIWEVDEPLQLDLAGSPWSRTSVGPSTSPLESLHSPSILGSMHIDRRIQGSVLRKPSTTTTWGPKEDDWYSEINNIERLPSSDLSQRTLDDVESTGPPHQPWHLVWPFFGNASQVKALPSVLEQSIPVPEYPHLVIYPPVYPHLELYPTQANKVTGTLAHSNIYPVFDIYPAVTPPPRTHTTTRTLRKTHTELDAEVFPLLGKRPVRNSKTHLQLHTEAFQDGIVWTPSGYTQDLSSLVTKRRGDIPVRESQRRPSQDNLIPLPSRSRSGTITAQSRDKVVFPLGQLPALPLISTTEVTETMEKI